MANITLTAEQLQDMMAKAIAAALASQPKAVKQSQRPKASPQPKAAAWDVEAAAVKAAEKAGFAGAKPRIELLTAKGCLEKGFRPKAGSKAIRVKKPGTNGKGMPLFHKSRPSMS